MLTAYRRHRATCKHRSRRYKSCFCPIWVQGVLEGTSIRRSLDLTNWEAAQRRIRDLEIHGEKNALSVKDAVDRWLSDCEARHLKPPSTKKYKHVGEELKAEWGDFSLRLLSVDDVRKLREEWKLSAATTRKRLEVVRGFLNFCLNSGWIQVNPAKAVKAPVIKQVPTMPYSDEEWKNILTAIDVLREIHPQIPETTQRKVKALILLMRYSGVRISDAVPFRMDRLKNGRLFLYTAKTGKAVYVPLPPIVVQALKAADDGNAMPFWSGAGKIKTALTEWQERLKKVFVIAGIPDGHGHRFRDTFAVFLLEKGVPLEVVAALLGNTVKVCEKHYAPWIESRQIQLERAVKATW